MVDFNERIATLEDRLKQLKAKQHQIDSRRRTVESRRNRKEDTRRKILVGAIILAKVEHGEISGTQLRQWLSSSLTRPDDRALSSYRPRSRPGQNADFRARSGLLRDGCRKGREQVARQRMPKSPGDCHRLLRLVLHVLCRAQEVEGSLVASLTRKEHDV